MDSLNDIRRRLILMQDGLPPGYRRVEYVVSRSSNARFDTGVAGNDTTLKICADFMAMARTNYFPVLGNYVDENTRCWRIIHSSASYPSTYIASVNSRKAGSSTSINIGGSSIAGVRVQATLEYEKATFVANGQTFTNTLTASGGTENNSNIAIGSRSTGYGTATAISHRWFGVKIWKGGSLIRNYIPAVRGSDKKAGFYDTVNHTFNASTGTQDFQLS